VGVVERARSKDRELPLSRHKAPCSFVPPEEVVNKHMRLAALLVYELIREWMTVNHETAE